MIRRLIFDVDGTLITGVNFRDSIIVTLNKLGIHDEEKVDLFLYGIKTYEQYNDNYNIKSYKEFMEKVINIELPVDFPNIFWNVLKSAIPTKNENLINTIKKLSNKYELVLLTNYFSQSQLNRLNNMGIGEYFIECYGEKCIKPNKDAYISACGNNKPEDCIMVGDDLYLDIKRAKEEGLHTIFVNSKAMEINEDVGAIVNSVEEISEKLILNIKEN